MVWSLSNQTVGSDGQNCPLTDETVGMPVGAVSIMLIEVEDLSPVGGTIPSAGHLRGYKMEKRSWALAHTHSSPSM